MAKEEIVQSPSPGIRLHSLVTLSVLQLVFNSASFVIRLALHLFTPPLGVLSFSTIESTRFKKSIWILSMKVIHLPFIGFK